MTQKVFNLVSGLIGAVSTAAIVLVTYFAPANAAAINASIDVGAVAIVTICGNFVKK